MSYKLNKWDCIIEPIMKNNVQIGGLYLGDIDCAQSAELMQRLQIGALLSVIDEPAFNVPPSVIHQRISVPDCSELNLLEYFPRTNEFIERHRSHTNVMVHCYAGISRSATAVIAYIMNKFQWSFQRTLNSVVSRRPQVKPNQGFIQQLLTYEQEQRARPSSNQHRILNAINNVTTPSTRNQIQSDTKSNKTYFQPNKIELQQIEKEISQRQLDLENLRKKYVELSQKINTRTTMSYSQHTSPFGC